MTYWVDVVHDGPARTQLIMQKQIVFVTSTDTGVGKTMLMTLLARHWRSRHFAVAALKPICSGGRADARAIQSALDGALTLDEINPWHFRAPLAPLLAARREGRSVRRADVLAHVRKVQRNFDLVLVEGAGGLLSPLGEDFNARDLIAALRARPVIVCLNRLGAVNQALLVLTALPPGVAAAAPVALMSPPRADAASRSNPKLLAEFVAPGCVIVLPRLSHDQQAPATLKSPGARRTLDALTQQLLPRGSVEPAR